MTVDVAIVAYGNRDEIANAVERSRALRGVGRVVVVDHGRDGSGDVARQLGADVLENPSNPGFGAGQNAAVRLTTADYVLLLNPDAAPDADGIDAGVALLDTDAQVAAVQG